MPRVWRLAGAVVLVALVGAAPASSIRAGRTVPPTRALLVVEGSDNMAKFTILTLDGKRLPVPARVRQSPRGLSPDARLIARVGTDAVLLGPVRGGALRTVLRGNCSSPPCPYGSDPSYAWSPNSRRLAAAANPARGATLLKVFDRSGQAVRSFTLPRTNAEEGGRAYHHLLSWSPDGSRLLLTRDGDYNLTAVVALELDTGTLRTLARFGGPGRQLDAAWSPNGRLVAFTSTGTHDALDLFSVIDAARARPIIQCPKDLTARPTECPGGTVWAPDSRSVFGPVARGIDRFFLTGRRANVIRSADGLLTPSVATRTGLVYRQSPPMGGRDRLYLYRFATGQRELLLASSGVYGITAVLPLARLP